MESKNKYYLRQTLKVAITLFSIFIVVIGVSALSGKENKTAYVNLFEVYDAFQLTKDLDKRYQHELNRSQFKLDSINAIIQSLGHQIQTSGSNNNQIQRLQSLQRVYSDKYSTINDQNRALEQRYREQVMNQLNQYFSEYGDRYGYDYIYGAHGDGTFLYASKNNDITAEIIEFINIKYNGNER